MISDEAKKPSPTLVGSTGMYYICYQLASRRWNVVPTSILADFLVICRNASLNPEVFITRPENIRKRIHRGEREGRFSYWLDPKIYEEFRDNWKEIGEGF